jgi:hypothetical protein
MVTSKETSSKELSKTEYLELRIPGTGLALYKTRVHKISKGNV